MSNLMYGKKTKKYSDMICVYKTELAMILHNKIDFVLQV